MDTLGPLAVAFLEQLCESRAELLVEVEIAPEENLRVLAIQAEIPRPLDSWTPEDLKEYQEKDPLYGKVVRYLLTLDPSDLKKVDACVCNDIGSHFLDQGILYKRQYPKEAPLPDYEEVKGGQQSYGWNMQTRWEASVPGSAPCGVSSGNFSGGVWIKSLRILSGLA